MVQLLFCIVFHTSMSERGNLQQTQVWLVHRPCRLIESLLSTNKWWPLARLVKHNEGSSGTKLFSEKALTDRCRQVQ